MSNRIERSWTGRLPVIRNRTVGLGLPLLLCFCGGLLLGSGGCSHITKRAQSPDVEGMEFSEGMVAPQYIGDVAGPVGLDRLKVEGLGLVTGLQGTGSEPPPSAQREYLFNEIKTHNVKDVNKLLSGTDNSMVQILGYVPPGARKGDRFDIQLECVPNTRSTSLEGGYLMSARLKPFLITRRSVEMGHNTGSAEGRVIVNRIFDSSDESTNLISAVIPGGGVVTRDRETGLALQETASSVQNTTAMSRAINARFTTRLGSTPRGVANPVSDRHIEILIPDEYSHNKGRYFHVLLNIAFDETGEARINRLEQLERQLHEPGLTSVSAIRLEAIGMESLGVLKRGLRSDDPQVRFHSAEALAYIGDNSGVEILRAAVEGEPAFRWHGLTALASLHDSTSEKALASLFDSESAETRYGAFQALRRSMPDSPLVDGDHVNREFMLHTVATTARPMVHFCRTREPEIVLFGADQRFSGNLLFIDRGLTIRAMGDNQVSLMRYRPDARPERAVCSSLVTDVIRNAAAMGCDYGDMLKLLKEAVSSEAIETRLLVDSAPRLDRSYRSGMEPLDPIDLAGESVDAPPPVEPVTGAESATRQTDTAEGIFGKINELWRR